MEQNSNWRVPQPNQTPPNPTAPPVSDRRSLSETCIYNKRGSLLAHPLKRVVFFLLLFERDRSSCQLLRGVVDTEPGLKLFMISETMGDINYGGLPLSLLFSWLDSQGNGSQMKVWLGRQKFHPPKMSTREPFVAGPNLSACCTMLGVRVRHFDSLLMSGYLLVGRLPKEGGKGVQLVFGALLEARGLTSYSEKKNEGTKTKAPGISQHLKSGGRDSGQGTNRHLAASPVRRGREIGPIFFRDAGPSNGNR